MIHPLLCGIDYSGAAYDDSECGVAAYMMEQGHTMYHCMPDPMVNGCWLARSVDGDQYVVYTSLHPLGPSMEQVN